MSQLSRDLLQDLGDLMNQIPKTVIGAKKRAANHMAETYLTMSQLIDQIHHWIKTGFVVKEKIVALFQSQLRSIGRGKIGKDVEFGLKWGINQIRGGYVHLFMMKEMRAADCDYAVQAIEEHIKLFGHPPKEYGFDSGGWSDPHMEKMKDLGVKRFGVAPKGREKWKVSKSYEDRIKRERAQVEGKIGTLKHFGFNKPEEKTTPGMRRAARRAELRFNCGKFLRDLLRKSPDTPYLTVGEWRYVEVSEGGLADVAARLAARKFSHILPGLFMAALRAPPAGSFFSNSKIPILCRWYPPTTSVLQLAIGILRASKRNLVAGNSAPPCNSVSIANLRRSMDSRVFNFSGRTLLRSARMRGRKSKFIRSSAPVSLDVSASF